MGIIQKQALKSSVFLLAGFLIGGVNILFLLPKLTNLEINGLTRALLETSTVLAILGSFGTVPVIYKFSPFYRSHLKKNENDLPFITGLVCLSGFLVICIAGYFFRDFIARKLGKSPLFAENFLLVYPFTFLMLTFLWMESFAWSLKRTIESNFLKETFVRILTSVLIIIAWFGLITEKSFINMFSILYLLPAVILFIILRKTGEWNFNPVISKVTRRFGRKMFIFGLYVFGATFLNIASKTMDSFVIIGLKGLDQTAIFVTGAYLAALMELPMRSINSIATPVLSESWKDKNYQNIFSVYQKSTVTLLVAAILLFCLVMLNVKNLVVFLGNDFEEVPIIVCLMGIAKIIDLGTGVNSQLIGTSSNWKFDFYTNVFLTIMAFPLNFFLIKEIGIVGGAIATLVSTFLFNTTRFLFIFKKYGWQPYNFKHFKILFSGTAIFFMIRYIPFIRNIYVDTLVRSVLFTGLFIPSLIWMKVSDDIVLLMNRILIKTRLKKL